MYFIFHCLFGTPATKGEGKWRVVTALRRANRWLTPLVLSELGSDTRNILHSKHNSVCEALLTFCVGLSWSSAPSLAPVASIFIEGNVGTTTTSCSPPCSKVDSFSFSFSFFTGTKFRNESAINLSLWTPRKVVVFKKKKRRFVKLH